ncbi:MAG: peptidoglycan editing factor PgeF [Myxococcota bacterium]
MSAATNLHASDLLTSPLLTRAGFRHAFFTRRGGVSKNEFASLNFSVAVGDDAANVDENLWRAAQALGVGRGRVYFASQVHGVDATCAEPSIAFEDFVCREADVVFGHSPEVACGVRTADCVPILLAAERSGHVAAVHAGWRGVVRGAVQAGLAALGRASGDVSDVIAAIGPHISLSAFEVSEDVAAELVAASPDPDVVERSRARPHVDLRRIVHAQLETRGISRTRIDDVWGCTYSEPDRFFSFRRDGKRSGRHLSAIVAR